jgi:hypothetical protein
MSSSSGTQPETESERAVAQLAAAKFKDYQTRWAPRQAALATTIKRMGAEGSFERGQLKAKSAADVGVNFAKAEKAVRAGQTGAGINPNSSASKLKLAGMDSDKAASIGLNSSLADQAIDDSYVQGLTSLMQIGRGQEATAVRGMADSARMSADRAASDAYLSAQSRAGNLNALGTVAGIGMGAARQSGSSGVPSQRDYQQLGVGLPTGIGIPAN